MDDVRNIATKFSIGKATKIVRFGNGLINDTYLIQTKNNKYILQKLHSIFKPSVLADTHNITRYISDNGLVTPIVVKTANSKLYFKDEKNNYWRMLTYIPGKCYEEGINSKQAFSAGRLVGQFHDTLSSFYYKFSHKIKDFNNSEAHIIKLKKTLKKFNDTEKYNALSGLADYIFKEYGKLGGDLERTPDRIIHGDLKINNVRFGKNGNAVCLLDLDTLGYGKIVTDMAGAVRTWCNASNEDDIKNSRFNLKVFENMLKGYLATARFITKKEIKLIPETIKKTILVLMARFIVDAFEEKYFNLNRALYNNLYEQNNTKAKAQLTLYRDILKKDNKMNKIIRELI